MVAIITFLQGLRRGVYLVTGLTAAAAVLFYLPDLTIEVIDYPPSFKSRFLFSFAALGIMALIYEFLRSQSQVNYQALSDELDRASRTDELTGLANRCEMRELLAAEQAIYTRYGHAFSVPTVYRLLTGAIFVERLLDKHRQRDGWRIQPFTMRRQMGLRQFK